MKKSSLTKYVWGLRLVRSISWFNRFLMTWTLCKDRLIEKDDLKSNIHPVVTAYRDYSPILLKGIVLKPPRILFSMVPILF